MPTLPDESIRIASELFTLNFIALVEWSYLTAPTMFSELPVPSAKTKPPVLADPDTIEIPESLEPLTTKLLAAAQ